MRGWLVAVALLLAACSVALPHHHHGHRRPVRSRHQLQSDLAQVEGRKAKVREQLRVTRRKAHAVKEDLATVDTKLSTVKARLSETRDRLRGERAEQRKAVAQLANANKELADTRVQVKARLRWIYMHSQASGFSVIAGTHQAGELASREFVESAVERKDRELFNRYTQLQSETAQQKRREDELVAEVAATAGEEASQTRELANVRVEKGQVLQSLRAKQGELEDDLKQFEEDEREITAQIAAYTRSRRHYGRELPAFTGRFIRPVNAPITSGFGMRYHPILHIVRMHTGVDFGAPIGTPIHAAADGDVIATTVMRGYGHVVILDHGGGISTVYAHTSAVYCSPGQHVRQGQVIAAVGNSGLSTGPHLHFEVRVNGRPVNPLGRL